MSNDHDEIIERLQAQAAAAAGRMVVHESEDMDPSLRERIWRHVVDFETAGTTAPSDQRSSARLRRWHQHRR